ncbi:MAG: hypothetical protein LBN71_07755, partial [Tannerella sp.]|nr:hypothetical protein [Tannerella sp.]
FSIKPFGGTEHATKTLFENYKWYHIACVYNSNAGTISLYVNGVLDNKEDCESGHAFSLNTATGPDGQNGSVGNWAQNRGFRFVGQADTENGFKSPVEAAEVRFWSVIRSEVQIKENMYGIDPATPGLVGYWKCNEGNGTDIHDISGNGHNAIIGTLRYGPTTRPDALNWNLNQSVEVGK